MNAIVLSLLHPPVGATYSSSIHFPLIGRQVIRLDVTSYTRACITLEGLLNIEDTITYSMGSNGDIHFDLSDKMTAFMNRYHCAIVDANYRDNVASIRLRIKPLFFNKRIVLVQET